MMYIKYPIGLKGDNYLTKTENVYSHSESLPNGYIRVIECDKEEKWMKVKERNEKEKEWVDISLDGLMRNDIINLEENGERWKGDSLNGSPFGYGSVYNSENHLIYQGFMYEGMKVCYGSVFDENNDFIEYVGDFYKGMRCGYGILYNKMKEITYEGEWYNDHPLEQDRRIELNEELNEEVIHFGIEELKIGNDCGNNNTSRFCLVGFNHLKKCVIGNYCFCRVNEIEIDNCNELNELIIGKSCFYSSNEQNNMKSFILSSIFLLLN